MPMRSFNNAFLRDPWKLNSEAEFGPYDAAILAGQNILRYDFVEKCRCFRGAGSGVAMSVSRHKCYQFLTLEKCHA